MHLGYCKYDKISSAEILHSGYRACRMDTRAEIIYLLVSKYIVPYQRKESQLNCPNLRRSRVHN